MSSSKSSFPDSNEWCEALRAAYAAGLPQGGTYHGLAAVTAHVEKGRGTWAEGGCEPERFIAADERQAREWAGVQASDAI